VEYGRKTDQVVSPIWTDFWSQLLRNFAQHFPGFCPKLPVLFMYLFFFGGLAIASPFGPYCLDLYCLRSLAMGSTSKRPFRCALQESAIAIENWPPLESKQCKHRLVFQAWFDGRQTIDRITRSSLVERQLNASDSNPSLKLRRRKTLPDRTD